jgi:uncharacterized membrane protein
MEQKQKISVLLVGESWMSQSTHHKGFDYFSSSIYETGHQYLLEAFNETQDIVCTHLSGHLASEQFPTTLEELQQYDVVILSDIGSNSLLLSREVFIEGKRGVNRLSLIKEYVEQGGGFCMAGGYLSFAGFEAKAKYFRTPIEEILPVSIYTFDDRVETPEGTEVFLNDPTHQIVKDIKGQWSYLLGYQEVIVKENSQLIASSGKKDPLLVVWDYKKGRTLAWMSDIGPHWCPVPFATSAPFKTLWQQAIRYLAKRI